ncbi:YcxB family protein [Cohnella endophytica]|uniref:YcxB family protein n=1 Tax=Cohnella endophytica TaxID=2419778 RepID=A0A494XR37_9BACL|nr:YcxB family protein [Cohnella endophytica]RKP53097.1 YcxB family protein [Cohnella endophytica]
MVDITFKYSEYMIKALRGFHYNSLRFWLSNGIGLAVVLLEIVAYSITSNTTLLWIALAVLAILAFSYATALYLQPMRFANDPRYNKLFTLSIGDEDIRLSSEDVSSESNWSQITKVWATKQFYYLFLDKRQFWIVPRDRFADSAQEEQFKQIVSRHQTIRQGLMR